MVPRSAARCPPALAPAAITQPRLYPYVFALARSQRMAALQSWIWAGHVAVSTSRYSMLATVYPKFTSHFTKHFSLVPLFQPPPCTQTTKDEPATLSGRYRSSKSGFPSTFAYCRFFTWFPWSTTSEIPFPDAGIFCWVNSSMIGSATQGRLRKKKIMSTRIPEMTLKNCDVLNFRCIQSLNWFLPVNFRFWKASQLMVL